MSGQLVELLATIVLIVVGLGLVLLGAWRRERVSPLSRQFWA